MAFNIVVIGTGIGGLGAAIALALKGHQVTVLEATSKLQPIGGIIVMQPNANRMLDQFGIYQKFLRICRDQPFEVVQRRFNGDVLGINTEIMKAYGYPYVSKPLCNTYETDCMAECGTFTGPTIRKSYTKQRLNEVSTFASAAPWHP